MIRPSTLLAALALAALVTAGPAAAHQPRIGPHGGALVDAGSHHAELVADGSATVTVHLSDMTDAAVPSNGFKAEAILIVDGKPVRFALEPAEPSRLVGTAPVPVPRGVRGAVRLTRPDGATAQAKF